MKTQKPKKRRSIEELKWAAGQPIFWSLLVCFSLFAAAATTFKFHLYPLLIEKGLSTKEVVGILAILGPSQVAGRVFMWVVGDKFTINNLGIITASMLPIVFIAMAYLPPEFVYFIPFAFLFGAASGLMTIVKGIAVPELLSKEGYGIITGAMSLPVQMTKALAPTITALVWFITKGYNLLLTVLIIAGFIVVLSFIASTRLTQKRSTNSMPDEACF